MTATRHGKSRHQQKNQRGFSLIELMIVVGIIGIIALIAAPNFQRWRHSKQLRQAARAIYSSMQQARLGAVKTGTTWAVWFDTANNRVWVSSDPGVIAGAVPTVAEWQSTVDNLNDKGQVGVLPIYLAGKDLDTSGDGAVIIPPAAPQAGDLLDVSNIRYGLDAARKPPINANALVNGVSFTNNLVLFYANGTSSVNGADYVYLDHCPDPNNLGSNANIGACGTENGDATAPAYAIGVFNTGFPVIRKWDQAAGAWE